jgi:EAL domain-containing protein (putative c-di-GMP-specific phosphodiesterase class I)
LADLGCGIDLDDFGTGYASITNIRRFSVGRIKIDRSFVAGVDTDSEQRNMVTAIPTIADRLGVQTLAEGVETRGEKDALNALGCHDVQGFQIARQMPVADACRRNHPMGEGLFPPIPRARAFLQTRELTHPM